jgi:hypothetical protein
MSMAIAALGDRNVAFLTHREIDAAIALEPHIRWVATDGPDARRIDAFDGLWVHPLLAAVVAAATGAAAAPRA